ncbi:MAG: queuosine precursor transporter [Acidobacteriota bacterium]
MSFNNRKDLVYLLLAGFFVTNALLAEILGGKLIQVGTYVMSMGVVPWPVVFLTTDLINEYFGRDGVRHLTFITVGLILFAFALIFIAINIPAAPVSPVSDEAFNQVLGQSLWIIVGSIIAFIISQLLDVFVFWRFRDQTGGRHLWLRSTGSTIFSQFVDTFVILAIAFWLPGKLKTRDFLGLAFTNYSYKLLIAVSLTPLIYLTHHLIHRFIGDREADSLIEEAVKLSH